MIFKRIRRLRLQNYRLSSKLIITYIVLTVIPMACLGYFSYNQYKNATEEQIGEYIPRFLKQANTNIEKHVEEMIALPKLLLNSEKTLEVLRKDSYQSRADQNRDQFAVNNYLARTYLNGSDPDILGVFVLSKNRLFYSVKVQFTGLDWKQTLLPYGQDKDLRGKAKIILPSELKLRFMGEEPYVLIMKQIQDTDNRKDLGTMLVAVNTRFIERILLDFEQSDHAKMWMVNQKGEIIYHTDHKQIGITDPSIQDYPIVNGSFREKIGRGEANLISVTESSSFNGLLVHSIPLRELTKQIDLMRNITIIVFIIFVIITTIFSIVFVLRLTRPIKRLIQLMKEVERGKFQVDRKLESRDEIGTLARSFNSMIATVRDLIEKNYDIKIRQKEAELYALQSQINPHFMYNTLETINMAVEEGETDTVVVMVTQLGRMLRYSVGNKSKFANISEELQHVKDYLTIQRFRFEDRLAFEIDCRSEVDKLYTPKFILQPIVENAIKYGLETQKKLTIQLSISREFGARSGGDDVVFRIRDNGPGIHSDRLHEVEESMSSETLSGKDSQFGLGNVNARIIMMHGPEFGLQLHSIDGIGTEVTVRIPAITINDLINFEKGA